MTTLSASHPEIGSPEWLELVRRKVETMRFGLVQIIVHEGQVTQIECTERTRLNPVVTASRANPARGA